MTPNVCVCILEKSYTDRKIYEHFHNHKILYMCIHKFQVIKQTIFPYYTRCITQKYQYQTIQYQPEGWNVMQFTKILITKKKFNGKNYRECTNYMYIERKTAFYVPYLRHNPKIICSLYTSFIQMKYRSDMLQCNTINIAKECVPITVMIDT